MLLFLLLLLPVESELSWQPALPQLAASWLARIRSGRPTSWCHLI